jgi:hypothetical protein
MMTESDAKEELGRQLTDDELLSEMRLIHMEASKRTGAVIQIHHYDRGTTNYVWNDQMKKWEVEVVIYTDEKDGVRVLKK